MRRGRLSPVLMCAVRGKRKVKVERKVELKRQNVLFFEVRLCAGGRMQLEGRARSPVTGCQRAYKYRSALQPRPQAPNIYWQFGTGETGWNV